MSWELRLIKTTTNSENNIEEVKATLPIGSPKLIIECLKKFCTFDPPIVTGLEFICVLPMGETMEVDISHLDADELVESVAFNIHYDDAPPMGFLQYITQLLDCKAIDISTSEFIEFA